MTSVADEVIADPVGLVVRLVGEVERLLDATRIREIVCGVVRERAGRRSLAQALRDDPSLLLTGRPPAPYCVAKLLMALREAGAQDISFPRCGHCGRERPWVGSQRGGQWSCSPCSDRPAVCAGCGKHAGSSAETATVSPGAPTAPITLVTRWPSLSTRSPGSTPR